MSSIVKNEECTSDDIPVVKVTVIERLQNEAYDTPVSSGGEEDDVKDFHQVLKDDPNWKPPTSDIENKLRDVLEQYFSDENLLKDKFLLKHVKRNKYGYVSVKLLTSFKKLKTLSHSDWKLTAYCVLKSNKLELNKSGTKVRRKEPIPDIDLPTTSIKTLLYKIPDSCLDPTIESISEQFRGFGELSTVRIIRAGKEVPVDLRNHTTKHPELGTQTCAVVEFENVENAQNAYRTLSKEARNENNKCDMYNLLGSGRNPRKKMSKSHGNFDSGDDSQSPYVSSRESSPLPRRKYLGNGFNVDRRRSSPFNSPQGSRDTSPERLGDKDLNWRQPRRRSRENAFDTSPSLNHSRKIAGKQIHKNKTSPLAVNNSNLLSPDSGASTPTSGSSPWLQRRRQYVASQGNSPSSTPGSSPRLGRKFQDGVPIGVLRLPRGPPQSTCKGFDLKFRRVALLNSTAAKLESGTFANHPAVVK